LDDQQFELNWYPHFAGRRYVYLDAAYSPHALLYPRTRYGLELFQSFGTGWEASLGYRRLNFAAAADIYTGSVSKYMGDWLFTLRDYRSAKTNSFQGTGRRYFGGKGNYAGLRLGRGATREDIRSVTDIEVVDTFYAIGEARMAIGGPAFLQIRAGSGRQRLPTESRRHTSGGVLLGMRF
jgi:YaiO family outer membrane protein